MNRQQIDQIAEKYIGKVLEHRHHLHAHPELSFQEYNTAEYIRKNLAEFGIPTKPGITGTSTVGIFDTGKPGPTILMRADIDALPVTELPEHANCSQVPGVMHACGHDIHTSVLLGVAQALSENPDLLHGGKVYLAFQAAEEQVPGGAKQMVADGAAEGVDMAFGFHDAAMIPNGTISYVRGSSSGAIGVFKIFLHGTGGHTSAPFKVVDPAMACVDIANAIQRLSAYRVDPMHTAAVVVSTIKAGNEDFPNVYGKEGVLAGTVRTEYNEDRKICLDQIGLIVKTVCERYDLPYDIELTEGYPANINAPEQIEIGLEAAKELGLNLEEKPSGSVGGEDYAYFALAVKKSAFFSFGLKGPNAPEEWGRAHCPEFNPDENGIIDALRLELGILQNASAK